MRQALGDQLYRCDVCRREVDRQFWHAVGLTAIYTGSTVVLQVIVGLGLAMMVLRIPAGQWLFRLVAILPIVLAPVVVGLFWRTLMLAPSFGIFEVITDGLFGVSLNWLGHPTLALVSVILIHTWQWTPFAFLVFLASLAALPPDLYEAAAVDGEQRHERGPHRVTLSRELAGSLLGGDRSGVDDLEHARRPDRQAGDEDEAPHGHSVEESRPCARHA
jgi:ABC-type sugar transport system permease subunit